MSAGTLPVLLICLAVTVSGAAAADFQCRGRSTSPLCMVSGQLTAACPNGATSLGLRFSGPDASWPTDGGLRECVSVSRLKVTGWSGPELTSGHLRQLGGLTSADIVDGGLQSVGGNVSTAGLAEMSLARNKILSLHPLAFTECGSLSSLDLSDNSITQLPDRFLINCRQLRTLRLTGNRLAELRPDALLGAGNLRELLMQRNRFQLLHMVEFGFINSPRLSLIDLRNNGLFSYQSGRRGFCGPANVTVRMHFGGCPPQPSDTCSADQAVRSDCVGTSAQLVVTFTSCQVSVSAATRCLPRQTCPVPARAAVRAVIDVTTAAPSATGGGDDEARRLLMSQLGVSRDGATWPLYALAATVIYAMLQLILSLAVCHRLKLRLARLQARNERLADECPSHRCFQHLTLCSQSALSGRMTPSGKGPSSHCGFSQYGGEPPVLPQGVPPRPPQHMSHSESPEDRSATAADAEMPLRGSEDTD